jgi:hypothetical protein
MKTYTNEGCYSYMMEIHPLLKVEIKSLLDALEENFEAIYQLKMVDEADFIDNYLSLYFKDLTHLQKSQLLSTYYDYINQL